MLHFLKIRWKRRYYNLVEQPTTIKGLYVSPALVERDDDTGPQFRQLTMCVVWRFHLSPHCRFKMVQRPRPLRKFFLDTEDIAGKLPRSRLQIFMITPTDKTVTLTVTLSDTVQAIKVMIHGKLQIPTDQQRLIFGCKQLTDDNSLFTYNIQCGSTIHLLLRLRGGTLPSTSATGVTDITVTHYHNLFHLCQWIASSTRRSLCLISTERHVQFVSDIQ